MKRSVFDKKKRVPGYLVPKIKKGHVKALFGHAFEPWQRFAEGCLRNAYFHEQVFGRGPKCLACDRRFNREDAAVHSRVEKHHACYVRLCTFDQILPEQSPDIYRSPAKGDCAQVPDCRACHAQQPEEFFRCLKRIYPLHAECHEDVHELEHYFRRKARVRLMEAFNTAS